MFLEVVLFAGDVGGDFLAVGESDAGDLSQGGVGLLRGHCLDLKAHAALLRAGDKVFDLVDLRQGSARLLDELINRRHLVPFPTLSVKTVSPSSRGKSGSIGMMATGCKCASRSDC